MSEASAPVVRTLFVPLFVESDARASLHATADEFNFAVTYAVERAPSPAPTDEELRGAVYQDILAETDLPRRLAIRAYAEAGDYLRRRAGRESSETAESQSESSGADDRPTASVAAVDEARFDHPSVAYDAESFTPEADRVTLQTTDGHVTAEYDPSERQRAYLEGGRFTVTDGVLHYVKETSTFYVQLNLRRRPSLA